MISKYDDKYSNAVRKVKILKMSKKTLLHEIEFWENEVKEFEKLMELEKKV